MAPNKWNPRVTNRLNRTYTLSLPKLLMIDDEPDLLELFVDIIPPELFEIRTASNLNEALASIQDCTPDFVISDCMLPEANGKELVEKIREVYANPKPLMLMSGCSPAELEIDESTYDGFFEKPLDFDRVIAALDSFKLAS